MQREVQDLYYSVDNIASLTHTAEADLLGSRLEHTIQATNYWERSSRGACDERKSGNVELAVMDKIRPRRRSLKTTSKLALQDAFLYCCWQH